MESSHFPLGVELFQSGRRLCRMSGRGRGQCERLCGKARYNENRLRMMELRTGIRAGLLFFPLKCEWMSEKWLDAASSCACNAMAMFRMIIFSTIRSSSMANNYIFTANEEHSYKYICEIRITLIAEGRAIHTFD